MTGMLQLPSLLLFLSLLLVSPGTFVESFVIFPNSGKGCSSSVSSSALKLAKRSRGFGAAAASKKASKKGALPSLDLLSQAKGIQEVLNPRYRDPVVVKDLHARLKSGQVVVLKDAFLPELAEALHAELACPQLEWDHNEDYHADGYHYRHFNIYDPQDFPPICKDLFQNILTTPETKQFMTQLTGRDCTGELVSGAPSYYGAGDHSLPHTDHIGQRTVAYVWHLSKNWRPEWGGALYWAQEPLANAFHHASFNSLVLFSVTPHSAHFVTTVSPQAKEKRLAYNGWWHSSWVPTLKDPLEQLLATPEQRLTLTHAQVMALQDLIDDPWAPRIQPPEREQAIQQIRTKIMQELYPPALKDT